MVVDRKRRSWPLPIALLTCPASRYLEPASKLLVQLVNFTLSRGNDADDMKDTILQHCSYKVAYKMIIACRIKQTVPT